MRTRRGSLGGGVDGRTSSNAGGEGGRGGGRRLTLCRGGCWDGRRAATSGRGSGRGARRGRCIGGMLGIARERSVRKERERTANGEDIPAKQAQWCPN